MVSGSNVDWEDGAGAPGSLPGVTAADQWKQPVVAATTGNITIATALNAGDTIDGRTLAAGERVLVKDQTTGSENGIYIVGTTPARATDMDSSTEVLGAIVYVIAGTTNTGTAWKVTNTSAVTVGSTSITFAAFGSGSTSFGTPAIVLGTAAAAGSASTAVRTDATIVAFDATTPATQAFGDAGTVGTAGTAAHRDHKHPMPTAAVTTSGLTQATGKMLGRSTASTGAIEEITVGTGLSLSAGTLSASGGGGITAVAVGTVDGGGSGDFTTSGTTFQDLTGASITITTGARRVKLGFTCVWSNNNNTSTNNFYFDIDGTQQGSGTAGQWRQQSPIVNTLYSTSMTMMSAALSAGSHTFKVRLSATAGSLVIKNTAGGACWNFWVEECPT